MAATPELMGLYWTVSGPVVVHLGREWSYFSWADRCAEARKVGFAGLGIWHADLEHVLESESLVDMKRAMDDNGLTRLELEFLMDWFLDPGDERRRASDTNRDLLLEAASVLGAHHVKVGNIPGTPASLPQLTERFGELCDIAAERTDAKIVYEFMPFDPNVRSIDAVLEVVAGAARPNGGVAIDTWHMSKLGIPPAELRRIPLEYMSWVELSDGQFADMDDPIDEVVNHRSLPGEGEFDVRGYVSVCQDHGYAGPWGVETLSEELRNNPIDVIFRRAYDATAAQFSPADPGSAGADPGSRQSPEAAAGAAGTEDARTA